MKAVLKTMCEAAALCAIAAAVAFGVNALRAKGSINLTRNYFDRGLRGFEAAAAGRQTQTPAAPEASAEAPAPETDTLKTEDATVEPGNETQERAAAGAHPAHGFQELSFEEVAAIFADPMTQMQVNVFVDARNDAAYEDGHIPGAVQFDHYRMEEYIDDVLAVVPSAEKIIVYCNGGDCEDSIFVCGDLLELGVPYDNLYLFAGGWKEWKKNNMPVARGRN